MHLERFSTNENVFSLRKRRIFQLMQDNLEKKSFLVAKKVSVFNLCKANRQRKAFSKHSKTPIPHRTQTNVQSQISSAKSHCELAAKQPIFETLQSCVCTTVTLSHRFKSSPAIPGKLAVFCAAGYMMNAGHLG